MRASAPYHKHKCVNISIEDNILLSNGITNNFLTCIKEKESRATLPLSVVIDNEKNLN